MDKAEIMVAQYWTTLLPKAEFEQKIHTILAEARERLERRKLLLADMVVLQEPNTDIQPEV
ncbi:MAG: hypothetical protein LBT26_03935 [Clostridiales Family XIII bacterium]|nr:hypothetical protein [Clostridiales Family XIII bacterium]